MGSLLNEDLIVLDADVHSAEDCIRMMGDLFTAHGYVALGYTDAVLAREEEFPTGLPGKSINIAIPHTNNKLVKRPAIGVIVPRRPVPFRMMGNKEQAVRCELILPLVIKDSDQQIDMLKKLTKIIQDGPLLQRICQSRSKSEIVECLNVLEPEEDC